MSSSFVNMDGSNDPFYRYQMNKPEIKVEGYQKMIKTIITNSDKLEIQIGRPAEFIISYMGITNGLNFHVERNNDKIEKAYISGSISEDKILKDLLEYIKKYVLCQSCKNPETIFGVKGKKKNKYMFLKCASCGEITKHDTGTKIEKYMINWIDKN